jgi:hypothetical protein
MKIPGWRSGPVGFLKKVPGGGVAPWASRPTACVVGPVGGVVGPAGRTTQFVGCDIGPAGQVDEFRGASGAPPGQPSAP